MDWIMRSAFLVDSTLTINKEKLEQREDFFFIPLSVIIDGKILKDMVDISVEEFYNELRAGKEPTTSQVSMGEFLGKFEAIRDMGYTDLFVFTINSKMSGTMQSAIIASEMVEGLAVHVIETGTVTAIGEAVAVEVAKFAKKAQTAAEIIAFAEDLFSRVEIFVYVDNLEALKKGGRISAAKALIGSMLQIRPILGIKDGVIDVIGKERTFKKAINAVFAFSEKRKIQKAVLLHTSLPELLAVFENHFKEKYPNVEYDISDLSPVIGVHIGPEAGAVAVIWEKEGL